MRTRVLLIAGDSRSRQRLATVLGGHGYEVAEAHGGVVGFRMADAHPPDLILLDLEMPNIDGYEVCRTLRNGWRTKQIPIVIHSDADRRRARHPEAHDRLVPGPRLGAEIAPPEEAARGDRGGTHSLAPGGAGGKHKLGPRAP